MHVIRKPLLSSTLASCIRLGIVVHQLGVCPVCFWMVVITSISHRLRFTRRCRRIAAVPNGCTFIQDPADACCQTLKCDPSAQFGTCRDALSNCASYGTYICGAQYKDWATQNCPQYCGYCGNSMCSDFSLFSDTIFYVINQNWWSWAVIWYVIILTCISFKIRTI